MISSKILIPLVTFIACVIALIVGTNLAMDSGQTMTYVSLITIVIVLLTFAREYWWIALFIAIGFGGFVYFGFKIYAHEALLAIAIAGLVPSVALQPVSEFAASRPKLPWFFFAALAYLIFQIFYSIAINDPRGFIEIGNIGRAYMNGIWPLMFVFLFRYYGNSRHLPLAIYLLQVVYLWRALLTLSSIYFPTAMMLPGINFVLPGNAANGGGLDDLRFSGHSIILLACAILLGRPALPTRALLFALIGFAVFCQMMSGGRALLVASIVVILAALAVARMWKIIFLAGGATVLLVAFLNIFPDSISVLDKRMQRAVSILIFDTQATEAGFYAVGSDIWHEQLADTGFRRWTSSPRTFLIGTGIRPWDETILRETNWTEKFHALIEGAANTGNYESGLWTILAPAGLVCFILYGLTLGSFVAPNLRLSMSGTLNGMPLTIAFLGSYPAFEWLLLSPRAGGYPAIELILACTAFYYFRDHGTYPEAVRISSDEGSPYTDSLT
jgi:hypothetical protein